MNSLAIVSETNQSHSTKLLFVLCGYVCCRCRCVGLPVLSSKSVARLPFASH